MLTVQENLPNFFKAVKLSQSTRFVKESRNLRYKYNFSFANKPFVDRLEREKNVPKKSIQALPWYHILFNPCYIRDFAYVPVIFPDRSSMIIDDD